MGGIKIRKAKEEDMDAVHSLVSELAAFEKAADKVITNPEVYRQDGFGEKPCFEVLVAEDENGEILGMALYFMVYSTWKGKMLFLDDLVVREAHRSKGIGKMLMDALNLECKERGIALMRWQVLDWNTSAIRFYEKLGAVISKEWYNCTLYLND
jgi:GNAT superfamily N-acetyltransferase